MPQTDAGREDGAHQPFPTKPPAYSRNGVVESDLIDFTPEIKAQGLEVAKRYRLGRCSATNGEQAEDPSALTSGTLSGGVSWRLGMPRRCTCSSRTRATPSLRSVS